MKTLRFYGSSDDTFGEETTGFDYDNCASGKPITFHVMSGLHSLYVTGRYNTQCNGCWEIGVCQSREDEIPPFPMRLFFDGYTAVLEIDVPDDVRIAHVNE